MATINYDLFWSHYLDHCELQRLEGILRQSDLSDSDNAIKAQRNFSGRLDWSIEAMLRSLLDMSVLQHRSIESLRRELMCNPTLMMALGFKLRSNADGRHVHNLQLLGRRFYTIDKMDSPTQADITFSI